MKWFVMAMVIMVGGANAAKLHAETRGKPYTKEQLLENSHTIFVGRVLETRTYEAYKRTVPLRVRPLVMLKGRPLGREHQLTPKDPGHFVYFDEEFSPARQDELGVFYIGRSGPSELLMSYQRIPEQ